MDSVGKRDLKAPGAIQISPGRLSVIEKMDGNRPKEFDLPLRFEIAAIVYCRQGTAETTINDISLSMQEGDMLVVTPNSVVERFNDRSGNCGLSIVMVADAGHFRSTVIDRQLWNLLIHMRKHPLIRLGPHERKIAAVSQELVRLVLAHQADAAYTEPILSSLADAFLYEILNTVSSRIPSGHPEMGKMSGQRVFLQFIDTLNASDGKIRSVEEMSDKLCVSSKYLARVVKENSGMTPSQWQDEYTMRVIVHQLRHTERSMKDIAQYMGFPSASSFGTFFKKHTGMSPATYRKKNR